MCMQVDHQNHDADLRRESMCMPAIYIDLLYPGNGNGNAL